ncbi:NAD(P)-dependent glycerol-3-phosphate dehydrogenase [bacterium]|nr:NAD(P)-dependent glycerol-3-phosphate dehydrogenase [bacterium]
MTEKDFWRKSQVTVVGGGSWGIILAQLASANCQEVRLWLRDEAQARAINSTRASPKYLLGTSLPANIRAMVEPERALAVGEGGVSAVIWALPSSVAREQARVFAPHFQGSEMLIHATKGIEAGSLKRISEVLREELPCARVGVISGPNLAAEIARGEPAATVVASNYQDVIEAGQELLSTSKFRVYSSTDMVGVEWAGTLKNILAIAAGALDALGMGWNARAMLITRGLAEMVRFGVAMGGETQTFLGLAGMGDLMATCGSPLSRNYQVGAALAKGEPIDSILARLGATAEGVRTVSTVRDFAVERRISMPISEGVYELVMGKLSVREAMEKLMTRPLVSEF